MRVQIQLAQAYRILAKLGWDDHTYTHLSARCLDSSGFYIFPFGYRFDEVTPKSFMKISLDGVVFEGEEHQYNQTGYTIHRKIYQNRSDINAIFHLHTPATVAVSALNEGLLPISQWALHFYNRITYHTYDSLALESFQGDRLAEDLGDKNVMLLRHHGSITCGRTLQEAMFYTYHLENACRTQCLALSMNRPLLTIPQDICEKSVHDLLNFEENLGERDWHAWVRWIEHGESLPHTP